MRNHAKTIDAGSGYLCQMEPVAHYGIRDGEKNISIRIDDGKPLIFEYNIHQKRVFYSFTDWMSIGEHTLDIEAKDNVGNSTKIRGIFNIK